MDPQHSLYLVRHAIAEERGEDWPDDTKRPLTSKGIERMKQQVKGLRALDVAIDLVLTSPLVRARQTADILVDGLKRQPKLRVLPVLAPGHTPAQVVDALSADKSCDAIAVVGHEPGLGELAAWLLSAKTPPVFRKGGVMRIDVQSLPPGRDGQLVSLATPKMLSRS
jgi:phosphohistidine phosphatase